MKLIKFILLFMGAVVLLTTSGCFFGGHRGGEDYHEHGEYRGHEEHYRSPEPEVDVRIHAN